MQKKKIPFPWYGGKFRIAPKIIEQFPDHKVYVEPFGGSAAVIFSRPTTFHDRGKYDQILEVFNDIDSEIVNFFRVIRDAELKPKLRQMVEDTPHSREEKYKAWADRENDDSPLIRAWRFYVNVNMGWSGAYAKSWGLDKRLPTRTAKWYKSPLTIDQCADRMKQVQLENDTWQRIFDEYDTPDTLFYCDPPYLHETRLSPAVYQYEFTDDDHRELLARLQTIEGKAILSGYDNDLYNTELKNWRTTTIKARVSAANNHADYEPYRDEKLWMNYSLERPAEMRVDYLAEADNIDALREIPDSSVDLIYADPPFNTSRDFWDETGGYSDNWKDGGKDEGSILHQTDHSSRGAELEPIEGYEWLACMPSQRRHHEYLRFMIPRLEECRRVLRPNGAIFLHCDYNANSVLRIVLDEIFGYSNHRSQIAWHYKATGAQWTDTGRRPRSTYDTILYYGRIHHRYQHIHEPYSEIEIAELYPHKNVHGERFRYSREGTLARHKEMAKDDPGRKIPNLWQIGIKKPKETTGYPTQKPLALLDRIVACASEPEQVVLDPFCGTGTTLVVAKTLDRRWIGIDNNPEAIAIAKQRLQL